MRSIVAILLVSLSFAGCLSGDGNNDGMGGDDDFSSVTAPANWDSRALYGHGVDPAAVEFLDGTDVHRELHDHNNRSHHEGLSTPNFEMLGWDDLTTQYYGRTAGGHFCGGLSGETTEGRQISVVHSITTDVAIVILDVTDPGNPTYLGELALPRSDIYDATVTTDGRYAVISVSPGTADSDTENIPDTRKYSTIQAVFTDACGVQTAGPEADAITGPGTLLVDISTPADPVISSFFPAPVLGPHSVSATNIDGTEFIASSTINLAYENSYFQFFTVEESPAGGQLVLYSEYSAQYVEGELDYLSNNPPELTDPTNPGQTALDVAFYALDPNRPFYQGHLEATIYEHPVTGQILAGLSMWQGGMATVDISTPAVPILISTWGEQRDSSISNGGNIHGMEPLGMIGDRFYVMTGQEVLSSYNTEDNRRPTGQVVIIDLTDPESPEAAARWTLPTWIQWNGAGDRQSLFSTHYFTVHDETLFVSMYHGGLWAADMSQEQWPELPSLGVYVPAQPMANPVDQFLNYSPISLDVFTLRDGSLLLYDGDSGAYTLRFHKDTQVPVQEPWLEDAWIST